MTAAINILTGFWKYFRFALPFVLGWAAVYAIWVGPSITLTGLLLALLILVGVEFLVGEDESTPEYAYPRLFVWMMWTYLPIVLTAFSGFAWTMSHGWYGGDLFGLAAAIHAISGFDMMAAHADDGFMTYLLATLLFSAIAGIGALSIGHELAHRTWEKTSVLISRTCAAFGLFTYYAIEHPYGHHYTVGTDADSSTALRGENVLKYALRTTPQDYQVAWDIETNRLKKLGESPWSWRNRLLRGWAGEAAIALFMTVVAGPLGLFWFLVAGLNTHFAYKLGTYGQHYGIVRVPGTQIKVHHSWTCNNRLTNWLSDNIGRHTDHHLEPDREFWRLRPHVDAPQNPYPYLTLTLLGLIPPLWHRIWAPHLIEWDEKWASPEERELAREANARSGIPQLMAHAALQAKAPEIADPAASR